MRGPATLDDVIAGIVTEAKYASEAPARVSQGARLRKVAAALRQIDEVPVSPSYEDLYTVKVAFYGDR